MQEPLFVEEPTLSVGEVSATVGRALARAFPDEVWVRGEIADIHRHASGHVYFSLVGDDALVAVTLFAPERQVVNGILRRAGGAVRMTDGTEVRIRARVTWFPRRGTVQLRMVAIDPAYTLGRLAEERERLLRTLAAEGVLERQSALHVPPLPLRVGLVTSDGSAAAADFLRTLEASGWAWRVTLVDARVQGSDAPASIMAALDALGRLGPQAIDAICLVRGGGARTDLAVFDDEAVARAIAASPVPVLTGIGHEVDTTVADLVAHQAYKTPTACASALVETVARFVDRCRAANERLDRAARLALERAESRLHHASGRAEGACRHHLRSSEAVVGRASHRVAHAAPRVAMGAARHVEALAARVAAVDPARLLARGWSVTRRADGTLVRSAGMVAGGDELVTAFVDGEVRSVAR